MDSCIIQKCNYTKYGENSIQDGSINNKVCLLPPKAKIVTYFRKIEPENTLVNQRD